MTRAPTLMIQGTASSVGKSLLVTALCAYFRKAGVRVAPFKSQNMALNAAVTPGGHEIGRAQAVQAEAAGLAPSVDMNPILIKPEGDRRAQIVVMGSPVASMGAAEYHDHKPALKAVIAGCLERLRAAYDLVVIEGAGSPAEINLKSRDIVNMHVAEVADAPVLLCGDIDRGGVFAAFVGTLALLEPHERDRVAGFVINKFRGDRALLDPGLDQLRDLTGKPVVGVIPYLPRLRIADEDSLPLDDRGFRARPRAGVLDVVIVRLPRISNHDDAQPLEHEPGVSVRFSDDPADAAVADLVILPGSKSTVADLAWLRATGFAAALQARAAAGAPILGICGGCQMLGERIEDPHGVEAGGDTDGLALLPLRTRFDRDKRTAQVRARVRAGAALFGLSVGTEVAGYEIHMGHTEATGPHAFEIVGRGGDGAVRGAVVGTMIHGLFEDDPLRAGLLATLRARRGLASPGGERVGTRAAREHDHARLAAAIAEHMDLDQLWRLISPIAKRPGDDLPGGVAVPRPRSVR